MNTQALFDLLQDNKNKNLKFEYKPNSFVGANYHITEVKHIRIDSVDCGANSDNWNETVIQLWESPQEHDKEEYMSAFKALGILNKVGKIKAYDLDSEVKFEYSNPHFHTAQMFINSYEVYGTDLIIKLGVYKTDCKAKEDCGIPVEAALVESSEESCCSPGGGCC